MKRREFIILLASAAFVRPSVAYAQPPPMPVIGVLCPGSPDGYRDVVAAVRQGLNETGYVEGRNLTIEYRWAEDHFDRLPAMAADLVHRQVMLIVTAGGTGTALAAKAATSTIPIVFVTGGDPLQSGVVASLSRPGGNITGVTAFSEVLIQKRFELLRELVPEAAVIGVLLNSSNPISTVRTIDMQAAARVVGQPIRIRLAGSEKELETVFATIVQERIGALVVQADTLFTNLRHGLAALAARHTVPAIYEFREQAVAGGLISYGASHDDVYREAGVYAGRVLNGAKPADLPVLRPTRFQLIINLKTARVLGLTIPPTMLARADEVIE